MPGEIFQLFVKGDANITKVIRISEDAKIKELMDAIHEKFDLPRDTDMRVVYTSKDIREKDPDGKEMSLQDYNICDEANLFIVHRLRGGSETDTSPETSLYEEEEVEEQTDVFDMTILDDVGDESVEDLSPPRGGSETDTSPESSLYEEDEEEEQIDVFDMTILDDFGDEYVEDLSPPPKMYNGEVELTKEADMFTLDDTEDGQRAKMPCGHAIGPESLTAYCRSLLTDGRYELRCPYKASTKDPFCNAEWEFFTVKRLAVLTEKERKEFETKMAENYLRKAIGIQDCPKCMSFCERQKKTDQRVICPVCTRKNGKLYEFCWFCLKTWLTNSINDCGNFGCTGEDPRLRLIKSCETKTVFGVECPAIRACPSCGMLIEHKEACKHMHCRCSQKFCFICLEKSDSGGQYQCGAWNATCTPAPRQTSVPGQ